MTKRILEKNIGATATESYAYDAHGFRIATTNALGDVETAVYDPAGRLAEVGGGVYPARYGYDAQGRRASLSTTRNGRVWDTTRWSCDRTTGLSTAKTYPDNATVTSTYAPDGLPLRTALARGVWKENAYDADRRLAAVASGDPSCCAAFAYDAFGNRVLVSNLASSARSVYNVYGMATNETISIGTETTQIATGLDAFNRTVSLSSRGETVHYAYAPDGRLAAVSNGAFAVEYLYAADRANAGHVIRTATGTVITNRIVRDAFRRSLVTLE